MFENNGLFLQFSIDKETNTVYAMISNITLPPSNVSTCATSPPRLSVSHHQDEHHNSWLFVVPNKSPNMKKWYILYVFGGKEQ